MKACFSTLAGKAGLLLCLSAAFALTSCDPYFGGPGYGAYAPAFTNSNYLYYPRYATYYHPQTNLYHYHNGTNWVSSPRPWNVSHNVIRSSPSVPLYLNSHPQYHHDNVMRTYPHNWNTPSNWHR
jgi:hypothetical protein